MVLPLLLLVPLGIFAAVLLVLMVLFGVLAIAGLVGFVQSNWLIIAVIFGLAYYFLVYKQRGWRK